MDNRVKTFLKKIGKFAEIRSMQCDHSQLLASNVQKQMETPYRYKIDIIHQYRFALVVGGRVDHWTRLFIVRIGHLDISCWVGLTMSIQFRPCLCRCLLPPCVECRHHLYLVTTDHQSCQQTLAKFSQYPEKAPTINEWVASKIFANQTVHWFNHPFSIVSLIDS